MKRTILFLTAILTLSVSNFFNKNLPTSESSDKSHLTFQIAIVCDKIPSDATVTTWYGETYEKPRRHLLR